MSCRALALLLALLPLGGTALGATKRKVGGARGILEVQASVAGADVMLDGRRLAGTPTGPLSVAAGTHSVVVKKLGYLEYTEKVKIEAGETSRLIADLLPFAGVIAVTSNVSKARVVVDGKLVGTAPLEQEVSLGQRQITVGAPGYKSYSINIRADAGSVYPIEAKLVRGADGAGEELELAPLVPLEPVAGAASGEADDLELAPLAPPAEGGQPDLELEALPLLAAPPPSGGLDPDVGGTASLGATVEPAKPWYLEWYAIAGAAAVLVTGATVAVVMLRGEEEESYPRWQPGENDGAVTFGGLYTAPAFH